MRFDARLGIAGSVAMTGQMINVADAYEHPLFYKDLDLQTGYRTRTLLAVPLRDLKGEIIGVGEAINKSEGLFTDEDAELLQTLAAHVSDTIEATQLERQLQDHPFEKESDRRPDIRQRFLHAEHHRHELQDSIDHSADRPDSRLLGRRVDRRRERHRQGTGRQGVTLQQPAGKATLRRRELRRAAG